MKCIVDDNVLLPLLCEGHSFQRSAYAWFDGQGVATVGWCLPVRLAILRHLSNERIMGSGVLRPEESLDVWEQLALDERMFEVEAVPPSLERHLRSNLLGRHASPKLWTDAWLAALAESSGHEMVTYDRGFRNFGLSCLRLLGEED